MIESEQSLGKVKLLLSQAATLCRKERRKLLLYFISMALAELDEELAGAKAGQPATRH